ncbi:MAG: prephenate dehydrogenase [Acholeplasmataceae bacterium]
MRVFIVGLGLIGGSYAAGLSRAGHRVHAYDIRDEVLEEGKRLGLLAPDNGIDRLAEADLVVLCLYPKDNVAFIEAHRESLGPGQLVTDVSGTKEAIIPLIEKALPEKVRYLSHHPMAGKAVGGFENRDSAMFVGANFLIVETALSTKEDIRMLEGLAKDLKFGKIMVTDAARHDHLIAFTSQLAHVIAISLMQCDTSTDTPRATGDSFRDLTRIANINDDMWSELFLSNGKALTEVIDRFQDEVTRLREAIVTENRDELRKTMRQAREKRKAFERT